VALVRSPDTGQGQRGADAAQAPPHRELLAASPRGANAQRTAGRPHRRQPLAPGRHRVPKERASPLDPLIVRLTGQVTGRHSPCTSLTVAVGAAPLHKQTPWLPRPAGMHKRTVGALREAQFARIAAHARRSAGRVAGPRPCQRRTAAMHALCLPSQGPGKQTWIEVDLIRA